VTVSYTFAASKHGCGHRAEVHVIKRTALALAFVLFGALAVPVTIHAQVAGTISGYVRDETGGVIPGAEVRAVMVGQQLTRTTTDTHTFSPTFLNETTVSYMDASSFRIATNRVPPRDMGINIDEGYLGVGMSLNVSGQFNLNFVGPERQVYRNWHWKDTMTLVRNAHTFKWGYEGQYVNFDLIRGNGARSATFTGTRSGSPLADFMLGAFDQVQHG
jgi:hypothetical protein